MPLTAPPPAPFRYVLRARYPECDAQGIVFNSNYGLWTDLATTELLRAIDPAWLAPGGFEYRLRAQETEWLAAARFDDVVVVEPEVVELGRTSLTVATRFTRAADGELLSRVRTVYVRVAVAAGDAPEARGGSQALSQAEREGLTRGAPGVITDHAGVGGGRIVARVGAAGRRTMPWANGGGVTHELWREGEGSAGFGLRLSIAEVAAPGPFSRLPGVDRVLVLLDGAGMTLTRDDGASVRLDERGQAFAFLGEDAWTSALHAGPTLDLNVMTDRATWTASVRLHPPGRVPGGLVFALAAGRIAGVGVERHELVRLDGPADATVPAVSIDARRRG